MPGSSLKLPLKYLNGHKTLGNPYFGVKLTVLNHSGQSLTLKVPVINYKGGGSWRK
jgi:hypothetical protein